MPEQFGPAAFLQKGDRLVGHSVEVSGECAGIDALAGSKGRVADTGLPALGSFQYAGVEFDFSQFADLRHDGLCVGDQIFEPDAESGATALSEGKSPSQRSCQGGSCRNSEGE